MDVTLPEIAFVEMPSTGETVAVKRGESGFYPVAHFAKGDPSVLNDRIGVTKAQAEAMLVGSMFGWDVPGAYAAAYTV